MLPQQASYILLPFQSSILFYIFKVSLHLRLNQQQTKEVRKIILKNQAMVYSDIVEHMTGFEG